ncbi:MAG: RNA-binding domain-containing protein [Acidobacteriota bacterium]
MAPSSLSGSIVHSLKAREMGSNFVDTLLSHNRTQLLHKDESDYWDYKEQLRLDTPSEIARLAKDVLAFHNSKGGVLIVGVDDDYRVTGIPRPYVIDTYKIKEKLQKYTGPNILLFQNTIEVPNNRVLWLVFVPKKDGMPVPVATNGPHDSSGRPEIRQGEYYMRLHDQSILCKEPSQLERLFTGASIAHLRAYLYDIDEPYFRLLAPYCDRFVGRQEQILEVTEALRRRHPIVALDGPGGVGKTEIAIEVARRLHNAREYLFIVSQSAKTQIWHGGQTTSRQAGFAGLTEFLTEIAKVLQITVPADHDELKRSVISTMADCSGLLLVDNIEETRDADLLRFLAEEIPDPVKVLVTSRIDKGLGPLTLSIPEMKDSEAQELLSHELELQGYTGAVAEQEHVDELLRITGKVPLALKWAAAIAASSGSLEEAVHRLGKTDAEKRQFLSFSFGTMYESLTPTARDAALLCPYIGEDWNAISVSMILDTPEASVEAAIRELKDRGILMSSSEGQVGAFRMLPMTREFLSIKFNDDYTFNEKVTRRIADLFVSPDGERILLNVPPAQRVEILYQRADELRAGGNFNRAEQMLKLALKWSADAESKVTFLKGRVIHESGQSGRMEEAIWNMSVVEREPVKTTEWANNAVYYAGVLDSYGEFKDRPKILSLLKEAIPQANDLTSDTMRMFSKSADKKDVLDLTKRLKDATKVYWLMKQLEPRLSDTQFIFEAGRDLMDGLRLAATSDEATPDEKKTYSEAASKIGMQYKQQVSHP